MPRVSRRAISFVRALAAGGKAIPDREGRVRAVFGERTATLEAEVVRQLISEGVLAGDLACCTAAPGARTWLRRQLAETDPFVAQHGTIIASASGEAINLDESPLARLARAAPGESEPYLARHHVEAGERVRALAERAQMQPRLTMSYDGTPRISGKGKSGAAEVSEMAADARRALARVHKVLPRDCAGVVIDVCGLLKGLQTVEAERGWPRRSAKLVLRIGLDELARYYGLAAEATGPADGRNRVWMDEGARPDRFE